MITIIIKILITIIIIKLIKETKCKFQNIFIFSVYLQEILHQTFMFNMLLHASLTSSPTQTQVFKVSPGIQLGI